MKFFFPSKAYRIAWLSVVFRILTFRSRHFIFIDLSEEDLVKLIVKQRGPWKMDYTCVGLMEYNARCILKDISTAITNEDLELEKVLWEGKMEEYIKNKANN